MKRTSFRTTLWAIAILPLLFGCGDESATGPEEELEEEIETNLTDPAAVVAAYGKATSTRDFLAYAELLDESFEFVPLAADVEDFPWLEGNSWGRVEELGIMRHMFDQSFNGETNPVDRIFCHATMMGSPTVEEGEIRAQCILQGEVLTSASDGWRFDTWHEFSLVWRGPYLRIRRIAEVDLTRGATSVENASWGSIKSLYRGPGDLVDIAAVIQAFAAAVRLKDNGALQALFCAAMPNSSAWEFNGATLQELSILEIKNLDAGHQQVACRAYWQLGPGEGWSAESRLVFLLAHREDSLCILDVTPLPEPL